MSCFRTPALAATQIGGLIGRSTLVLGAAGLVLTVSSPAQAQSCSEVAAEISNGMDASTASYNQKASEITTRYNAKIDSEEAAAEQRFAAQVKASPAQIKPLTTQLNAELKRIRAQRALMRQEIKPFKDQNDATIRTLRSYRVQANSAKCTPAHAVTIMQGAVQALSTR